MEKEPTPETPENIDAAIKKLLETLDELNDLGRKEESLYDLLSPELKEEMYLVEMQARAGEDRKQARVNLEGFIAKLKAEAERLKKK